MSFLISLVYNNYIVSGKKNNCTEMTYIGGPPAGQGGAVATAKIFGIINNLTKIDT
jgi:hypothetical protein